jgi:hypothetical protein
MKYLTILALLAGSVQAQNVSIPAQTACSTIPAQTVCVTLPARTLPVVAGTTPPAPTCVAPQVLVNGVCTTPVTPPKGVTWMYLNGTKTAAADFSGSTTNWFNATTAGYNGGKIDIKVSGGCFIPVWASNYQLPNPGWTYLLIAMKPSSSNAVGIHFEPRINGQDADIYPHINLADSTAKYGPAPQAGVWASYKIPLADLGVPPGTLLYKAVMACDGATYEFDAIGFQ